MKSVIRNIVGNIRGAVAYALVNAVNDAGAAQTVDVSTGSGVDRASVEVAQAFGFSSVPPSGGAVGVVIEIGGDPSNLIALPLGNPSARFAGLLPGEVVIYAADGSRVHIRQGGNIEVWAGNNLLINTKSSVVNAPEGITINSNLQITGNLSLTGNLQVSGNLQVGGIITGTVHSP